MEIDSKSYFCVNDLNKNIRITQGREVMAEENF